MKLTKSKLKQLIKEELNNIVEQYDEEPGHPGPTEENQDLVVAANDALHAAKKAITDLSWAVEEEGFKFSRDSSVTYADVDSKMFKLDRSWKALQGLLFPEEGAR